MGSHFNTEKKLMKKTQKNSLILPLYISGFAFIELQTGCRAFFNYGWPKVLHEKVWTAAPDTPPGLYFYFYFFF